MDSQAGGGMSKRTFQSDYHVVVYPNTHNWSRTPEREQEAEIQCCNEIIDQIKRHVDDVKSVEMSSKTNAVCEFCGSLWTEVSCTYNGGCCNDDVDAEDKRTR